MAKIPRSSRTQLQTGAVATAQIPSDIADTGQGLEAIRSGLMGNESTMAIIRGLQSDPDVQAILRDPELMSALQRMDLESLGKNSNIQRLMNNPKVKKLGTIVP